MTKHKIAAIGAGLMLGAALAAGAATPALAETLDGIDIASYQAGIDASEVEGDFVIPKATQGTGYTNPYWRTWADQTLSAGKKLGLYHYASGGNATAEADHFINEVGGYAGKAVFYLDWESYQNSAFESGNDTYWIQQFAQEVYNRTGQTILVYGSRSVVFDLGVHNGQIWVAQYATNNNVYGYQSEDNIWHSGKDLADGVAMRQYTSRGFINGWGGALDLDIFYGDASKWDSYANGSNAGDPGEVQPTYTYGIDVDGWVGYNTITAWQQELHAGIVDGSISGHNSWRHKYAWSVTSWDKSYLYGSHFVKVLQQYLNDHGYSCGRYGADGYLGRDTVKAVQRYLQAKGYDIGLYGVDGYLGSSTARALQQSLNDDAWE
jgi:GH25 family lysozyme M1 (1,4-beta-N-acetylmuramidase)